MLDAQCQACSHTWSVPANALHEGLRCPACGATPEPRAAEDFVSAVEDALAQLSRLRQTHAITLKISTERIPTDFNPNPSS